MQPVNELRFAVNDRIRDAEVGPTHVPLSLLGEFQKDVSEFLRGAAKDVDLAEVIVSVEAGSLALVASGLLAATTLWTDLQLLRSPDSLGQIDPKRAAVVERWQVAAQQNSNRKYRVADSAANVHLIVDSNSDFRKIEEVWIQVEKYVLGRVVDWGGKNKPNVHLETENGDTLVVSATQDILAREEQNRLYRSALLHITAEENLLNGKLRSPRLLAFETHQPTYDESEFQEMVRRGSSAWTEVKNATEWVDGLRGGSQ